MQALTENPDKLAVRLAGEYRSLYRLMTQAICDQQRKVKEADDDDEVTLAQQTMTDMSSYYHVCLRAIIDSVPQEQRAHFWKHT